MKKIYALLFTFSIFLFPSQVMAQTISISPAILKIELSPGKTTTQDFVVKNPSSSPLPLKISVEGFDSNDEDYGVKVPEKVTSPLADWIKLDTTDTIIPANSQIIVTATINTPNQIPFGGYYAVIFFDPLSGPLDPTNQTNQVSARVGAITLANIGLTKDQNEAEIITLQTDRKFYNNTSPHALLRVKNTGLNFFTAKPTLSIKPLFGKTQELNWEEKTILPGKVRRWEKDISLSSKHAFISKVTASVSLENGQFINQSLYIYHLPLNNILLTTIFFSLSFILIKYRKGLKNALKILVKRK